MCPHLPLALVDVVENSLVSGVVNHDIGAQALPHCPRRLLALHQTPERLSTSDMRRLAAKPTILKWGHIR